MSEIVDFRKAKDRYFGGDEHSPLTPEQRKRFSGLRYFAENPKLQFLLGVDEFPKDGKDEIQMATSSGDTVAHVRWAKLNFEVDGVAVALTVYRDLERNEYFLPFMDATTGDESYADGRYLDLPATGDGRLVVDFNYAYNPYCAYNPDWSCPIAPSENRLPVAIKAGEKIYPDASH
ncbi:MAG: DUF1684 domain-containing protein [Chloroflexi bacterium]|nr:DUF1684 domain-containing protein [Chloroflexota bacterium]MDA1270116.1 DUF1684 domain-containing protein [Chloroflexota bacterium]